MIVVVIIVILATMAAYGYGKWISRARRAEAVAMLAEMSAKEQVYIGEFAAYLPLRADDALDAPSTNESAAAFYPISPDDAGFNSRRVATSIANPAGWPQTWRAVGLRPRRQELYCTYIVNAGRAGQAVPGGADYGNRLLGAAGGTITPWFYALAACNFLGVGGLPNNVHVMGVTHNSSVIREFNEGQ